MKIAMYGLRTIGAGSGGVERAVEELSTRLARRGHQVTVYCRTRYNRISSPFFHGIRLVNLPTIYTKHLEAIIHSLLAASCATARNYDVVHVHAVGPALTAFIPRAGGRRVIATIHAMDWQRQKWGLIARWALKVGARSAVTFPHRTIVVSRVLQHFIRSAYDKDTVYIPNGINPLCPRPLEKLRRFGLSGMDYLLFLGRLVPEKGCDLLIKAFRATDLTCHLLIVGGSSHSDAYVARLHDLAGNDSRIIFTGPLFGEEKEEAYSNAIGLVFPSLLEGMPLVLLEALSIKCPVLCSDIPENMEIVAPPNASPWAATFRTGDIEALRDSLVHFVQGARKDSSVLELAAQWVAREFNWDRIAEQTERVYVS